MYDLNHFHPFSRDLVTGIRRMKKWIQKLVDHSLSIISSVHLPLLCAHLQNELRRHLKIFHAPAQSSNYHTLDLLYRDSRHIYHLFSAHSVAPVDSFEEIQIKYEGWLAE